MDFDLRHGEIHALIGGNGAGKSTLIKVLTGVEKPDSGQICLEGKEVHVRSSTRAATGYQYRLPRDQPLPEPFGGGEHFDRTRTEALRPHRLETVECPGQRDFPQVLGMDIDVTRRLDTYSVAIQQMVAIVRALEIESARVLILDEPTSSLSVHETEQLFEVMRRLKSQEVGIIFITHFIDQVYKISDRVTIIRNGLLVGTYETENLPRLELITKMLGKTITVLDDLEKRKKNQPEYQQGTHSTSRG